MRRGWPLSRPRSEFESRSESPGALLVASTRSRAVTRRLPPVVSATEIYSKTYAMDLLHSRVTVRGTASRTQSESDRDSARGHAEFRAVSGGIRANSVSPPGPGCTGPGGGADPIAEPSLSLSLGPESLRVTPLANGQPRTRGRRRATEQLCLGHGHRDGP